jgi:mercuric ion transport protein
VSRPERTGRIGFLALGAAACAACCAGPLLALLGGLGLAGAITVRSTVGSSVVAVLAIATWVVRRRRRVVTAASVVHAVSVAPPVRRRS